MRMQQVRQMYDQYLACVIEFTSKNRKLLEITVNHMHVEPQKKKKKKFAHAQRKIMQLYEPERIRWPS